MYNKYIIKFDSLKLLVNFYIHLIVHLKYAYENTNKWFVQVSAQVHIYPGRKPVVAIGRYIKLGKTVS